MSATEIVLLTVVGVISGAVNAVAGGGSLIVFPALLAAGLPVLDANVTNSIAQWPSYLGATVGQRSDLIGQRRRLQLVLPVAAAGSFCGALLLLVLPSSVFDAVVPILVLAASALMAFQPQIKRWTGDPQLGQPDRTQAMLVSIFFAAIYGGYFGGALGVILMALLAVTANDSLRRINATKMALSLIAASVTIVVFTALDAPVHWVLVATVGPATLVGGFFGAKLAQRLNDEWLRWSVVVLGVAVGIYLLVY
ncbi:MAG: sulfite exporter TauE/SafE family protein [Mycobacteriaceae bacterium]